MTPSTGSFVRPAGPGDADSLAQLQRQTWLARYGLLISEVDLPDVDASRAQWADLVAATDSDGQCALVLAALADGVVVGVLAAAPADDPDLADTEWQEVLELAVDGAHVGQGHGSRLLAAWADTARAAGTLGGAIWVRAGDDDLRSLLIACGFEADGAHRTLDLHGDGTVTVQMLRLSCVL
ncbi:MAG: hypothetical protein QG597_1739 [Actinomycetota bacterium]|nr:hypothetical protein [Actinomycetota bacterium]